MPVLIHPDTELRFVNATIGYGVIATRPIPRGTITWVRDELDQSFSHERLLSLPPLHRATLDKYGFLDGTGAHILCWDHARFVNHACAATCLSAGWDFELAVRDIAVGEELSDDYGTLNLVEPFACSCGDAACRRTILPDDMDRHGDTWDALARAAILLIPEVAQPLWPLVREQAEVEAAAAGRGDIPTIRRHDARWRLREVAGAR